MNPDQPPKPTDAAAVALDTTQSSAIYNSYDKRPVGASETPYFLEALKLAINLEDELADLRKQVEDWKGRYESTHALYTNSYIKLTAERDEMEARSVSLALHLTGETLAGDVQKWRDEAKAMISERDSLRASFEGMKTPEAPAHCWSNSEASAWESGFEAALIRVIAAMKPESKTTGGG